MPQNTSRGYTYPLYGDPVNFPAQIQDLATDIDTDMDLLWDRVTSGYNQAACRARGTAAQAIAANTDVAANYAEEMYDNAGMINLGTSTTTISVTQTGLYIASARVNFNSNGNATVNARQIALVSSGTLGTVGRKSFQGHQSVLTAITMVVLFWAASGTTLQMIMRQNSGASLNAGTRSLMVARMGGL